MPRPLRIFYPDACYHVMNRGAAHQKIFKNNLHRTIFIDLLRECCKLFNIKIYAYCLMDNHYHLLLSTPDANLSRVMRHLNGIYTQKYNRIMKKDGSLFRGRYHAKLVEEDCYRLLLTRYIHLNPVEAGIVENPANYRWSSYRAYLGLTKKSGWLSITPITEQLQQTVSLSHIKNYQDYVEEESLDEINTFISKKHTSPIVGSALFIENALQKIDSALIEPCSTDVNRVKTKPSLELISSIVCSFYQVNHESLLNVKPGKRNLPKLVFIYICNKEFGHELRHIAKFTGFTRYESISAATWKCRCQLEKSPRLAEQVRSLAIKIKDSLLQMP